MRFGLWTFVAAAALLTGMASSANAQASGSYQATCRRIQASGGTLTAECRDPSGKYHSSSIAYTQCKGDIGNNNGALFCNGAMAAAPAGGNGAGRGNGGGAANDPAAGSFRATCRNIQTSGGTLRADCADPSGRYHGSSIAFGQCRSDISNSNGMLSCNGATAVADGANNSAYDNNNGQRGGNFSNGPSNAPPPGFDRNDNGPPPGYGRNDNGPGYGPPPAGRFDNGGRDDFTPGPYPQFDASARDILLDIRDGRRDGRLSRRDADDFRDQLQQIQDREDRIFRAQGRYIRPDDARQINRDLDFLSQSVHRAERR